MQTNMEFCAIHHKNRSTFPVRGNTGDRESVSWTARPPPLAKTRHGRDEAELSELFHTRGAKYLTKNTTPKKVCSLKWTNTLICAIRSRKTNTAISSCKSIYTLPGGYVSEELNPARTYWPQTWYTPVVCSLGRT